MALLVVTYHQDNREYVASTPRSNIQDPGSTIQSPTSTFNVQCTMSIIQDQVSNFSNVQYPRSRTAGGSPCVPCSRFLWFRPPFSRACCAVYNLETYPELRAAIGVEATAQALSCTTGVQAHEEDALRAMFRAFVTANTDVVSAQVIW